MSPQPRPWLRPGFGLALLLLFGQVGLGAAAKAGPTTTEGASPAPQTLPPEQSPLPIGMTPEEETRRSEIGTYTKDTLPPAGPTIRQCAEWEPVTGALVRYPFGLPYTLLQEISKDIELWVLVANASEQAACTSSLQSNGVNMARVHFTLVSTNSIWTRDYGPQFIFDAAGSQGIVDHHYNRPRPLDDQVNYTLGTAWTIPVYGSPLIHTGGNYMCDGHGNAFSTRIVCDENPSMTEAQIDQTVGEYLGISDYHVISDISSSGIHHIDCWAKLLNEETILVKQVATSHPDYAHLQANVDTLKTLVNAYGRHYKIVRVLCGSIGGSNVAAYTNSVILDKKVLVPTFGISTDAAALQTYRDAMPGYVVAGFSGSWYTDDAVHCRVMGIHDKYMLRLDVAALPDTIWSPEDVRVDALCDDRSQAGLKTDSLLVFWRVAGEPAYQSVPMTASAGADSFSALIPGQPPGTKVEYYAFAADLSQRRATRPPSAPDGSYSYLVMPDPAALAEGVPPRGFGLEGPWPNPSTSSIVLNYRVPSAAPSRLAVFDIQGRLVATLADMTTEAGAHNVRWSGRDDRGREMPDGIYLFRLVSGGHEAVSQGVRFRSAVPLRH